MQILKFELTFKLWVILLIEYIIKYQTITLMVIILNDITYFSFLDLNIRIDMCWILYMVILIVCDNMIWVSEIMCYLLILLRIVRKKFIGHLLP